MPNNSEPSSNNKFVKDDHDHFQIEPIGERTEKTEQIRKPGSWGRGSGTKKWMLSNKADVIFKQQNDLDLAINDDIYFIIQFTGSITSKSISRVIQELKCKIINYYQNNSLKIAIKRNDYKVFCEGLETYRNYINSIDESYPSKSLAEQFSKEPKLEELQNVSIQMVNLSGLNNPNQIVKKLQTYIEKEEGTLDLEYVSDKQMLLECKVKYETIKKIVKNIGIIEKIEKIAQLSLDSIEHIKKEDVNKLEPTSGQFRYDPNLMPIICIVDSGVNTNHEKIKRFVEVTYDHMGKETNTVDTACHGTGVSSLAIYGGNLDDHTNPKAKVIMIKGFEKDNSKEIPEIVHLSNPIKLIQIAIEKSKNKTKIINLSFSSPLPQNSLTSILDEIIYNNDKIVVTSAGNINKNQILYDNQNQTYPNYLLHRHIYFPGDCLNTITIGSFTNTSSNSYPENFPSPFTRTGIGIPGFIKPDMVEYGGNMNIHKISDNNDLEFFGVTTAVCYDNKSTDSVAGTSFSAPTVATIASQILQKYPYMTPYLVKALLLSSCIRFNNGDILDDERIQGFGKPRESHAIKSMNWRVCYTFQGSFNKSEFINSAISEFFFPNNANKVTLTISLGRLPLSNASLKFEMHKSGTRENSKTKPNYELGNHMVGTKKLIENTYQGVFIVKRGGIGPWKLKLIADFDRSIIENDSLKYGCVITVESTKSYNVYDEIYQWINNKEKEISKTIEVTQ